LLFEAGELLNKLMASGRDAKTIVRFLDSQKKDVSHLLKPENEKETEKGAKLKPENEKTTTENQETEKGEDNDKKKLKYLILRQPKKILAEFKDHVSEEQFGFFEENNKYGINGGKKRKRSEKSLDVKTDPRIYGTYCLYHLKEGKKGDKIEFQFDGETYNGIKTKSPERHVRKHIEAIKEIIISDKHEPLAAIKRIVKTYKVTLNDKLDLTLEFKNGKKSKRNSLLHLAAYHGSNIEIFEYLIEEKECIKIVDHKRDNGSTALHEAVFHNHKDIVQYLLPKCNLKIDTKSDYLPLHHTFKGGKCSNDEIANMLLKRYLEQFEQNGQGNPEKLKKKLIANTPNSSHWEHNEAAYEEKIKNFFKEPIGKWKRRKKTE
jgi:hypothetical protein